MDLNISRKEEWAEVEVKQHIVLLLSYLEHVISHGPVATSWSFRGHEYEDFSSGLWQWPLSFLTAGGLPLSLCSKVGYAKQGWSLLYTLPCKLGDNLKKDSSVVICD